MKSSSEVACPPLVYSLHYGGAGGVGPGAGGSTAILATAPPGMGTSIIVTRVHFSTTLE